MFKEAGKLLTLILVVLGVLGVAYASGAMYGSKKTARIFQDKLDQMQERVVEIEGNQKVNTEYIEVEVVKEVEKIKTVYKDRIKEVIKYEEVVPDARDSIGVDWVRVHDTLVAGSDQVDGSAPGFVDAAARVTKADALKVIGANYEAYQMCAARVEMWELFYKRQQEAFVKQGDEP